MVGTRPDLAYSVGFLSRSLENPSAEDIVKVKRVFRYIAGTVVYGITYHATETKGVFHCYSDSDFGGCTKTSRSTSGYVMIYAGGAISWRSQRQAIVATSTTEAEVIAASEAAKEVIWLCRLIQGIVNLREIPTLQVDNRAAVKLSHNPEYHRRTKHIEIKHFFMREKVLEGKLNVKQVSTEKQVSDILTKPLMKGIEKAEVIADSLQEQFEPNHVAGREEFDQCIHAEVEHFLATPHVQEFEPTTPTEVLTYVQRIKPKKSPGLDQISNRMIKNLSLKFLLFITLLINQLFKNNYFPDSWKTAVVISILKPDKSPELAQNYRPIPLLSSLSKVYEFVLLRRLNHHCAASNMIIPQQCGFPHCSTVHQLLRVTKLVHSGFEKHDATGILFLDIAKAFDKIWHDGLLIKLIRLHFPAPLIKSIHSFLSHRSFRVRVDRILSSPRPI
ncbi:retrovirus-related Pol polyprotein from transposon TNT 1-94 [Trichonephila clavipes]|nr:retrovirus-related Pol polyprotein from transposon TNT 1-94 [Trichonephila clavipes]